MKKHVLTLFAFLLSAPIRSWACEVCKRKQPEGLENITHGPGPEGMLDYFLMYSSVAVVLIALFLSIKYLIRPGELRPDHIKQIIIDEKY